MGGLLAEDRWAEDRWADARCRTLACGCPAGAVRPVRPLLRGGYHDPASQPLTLAARVVPSRPAVTLILQWHEKPMVSTVLVDGASPAMALSSLTIRCGHHGHAAPDVRQPPHARASVSDRPHLRPAAVRALAALDRKSSVPAY
jgi:hypothetical protein